MAIQLGDRVRDRITGYEGVVDAITYWLNGCVRLGVQGTELKDGLPRDKCWFDQEQCEFLSTSNLGITPMEPGEESTGGDREDPVR